MKITYFVLFFLSLSLFCQAQESFFGEADARPNSLFSGYLLDADESGFYIARWGEKEGYEGAIIEHYNLKLNKASTVPLKYDEDYKLKTYFTVNHRCFYSYVLQEGKSRTYYYQEFDKKNGKSIAKPVKMGSGTLEKKDEEVNYRTLSSKKKNYTAFYTREKSIVLHPHAYGGGYNRNPRFNPFNLMVLDENMETAWQKEEKLEFGDKKISIESDLIDDDGNLFLLVEIKDNDWKKKRKKGIPYIAYKIIAYLNNGTEKKIYNIDSGNQFFLDVLFTLNEKEQIICVASHNDIVGSRRIGGLSYYVVDIKSDKLLVESTPNFSVENLDNFKLSRKNKKTYISAAYNTNDMEALISTSDGGAYRCFEYVDYDSEKKTTKYYEIVVVRLSSEGKVEWTRRVEKKQICSSVRGYCSYSSFSVQDKLYLIYNLNNSKKDGILLSSIDKDGKISHQNLTEAHNLNVKYISDIYLSDGPKQISPNEFIIYGQWNRKGQYGRLKF